jgi:excisionase family DNA binding protein
VSGDGDKRTDFLTARQLADHLQVSETTVHRLRRSGKIPAVHVTDRLVRYNLRDVRRALMRTASAGSPEPTSASPDDRQLDFADVFESFEVASE